MFTEHILWTRSISITAKQFIEANTQKGTFDTFLSKQKTSAWALTQGRGDPNSRTSSSPVLTYQWLRVKYILHLGWTPPLSLHLLTSNGDFREFQPYGRAGPASMSLYKYPKCFSFLHLQNQCVLIQVLETNMHEKKKSETHYSFTLFIGTFGFEDSWQFSKYSRTFLMKRAWLYFNYFLLLIRVRYKLLMQRKLSWDRASAIQMHSSPQQSLFPSA